MVPFSGTPRVYKVLSVFEYIRLLTLQLRALLVLSRDLLHECFVLDFQFWACARYPTFRCRGNLSKREILDAGLELLFVALKLLLGDRFRAQRLMILRLVMVYRPGISETHHVGNNKNKRIQSKLSCIKFGS